MTDAGLRRFLIDWQFWILEGQFALVVVSGLAAIPIRRFRATSLVPGALFVIAWWLAATVPPRTNRIFYDEHIYQSVAQSLSDSHRAELCYEGEIEYGRLHCRRGEYNKEPLGYSYLLSLVYRVVGVDERWAMVVNNFAAAATVAVVMDLSLALFGSPLAAVASAVVLMLLPMQLTWSNTAAAEPVASLLSALAVLAAVRFARSRSIAGMAWMIAMTAFATTARPESILIVIVIAAVVVFLAPDELRRRRLWVGMLAGAGLMLPTALHLIAVRNEAWGAAASRFSFAHAAANLPVNLRFYLLDERFPVLVGLAAIIGLYGRKKVVERLVLVVYFLTFWAVFVFFYAGSYDYGADVRYSLLTYVPVAVLAGLGIEIIASATTRSLQRANQQPFEPGRPPPVVFGVVCALIVFQFLWYAPLVRSTGEEAWAARADVKYARTFAQRLPPNSIVLTHNPSMFLLWGVDAGQLAIAVNEPDYVRGQLRARYAGGVYLHWNFWCNVADLEQRRLCETSLRDYATELVDSRRERDFRFALYRVREP